MREIVRRLQPKLRRLIAKSWILSRCYYPVRGHRLAGRAKDEIWYFAYGANMHDSAFRIRRGIQPLEHHTGHIKGYRLRFDLDGRPKGKAAPANLQPDPDAEVWGVLCRITRRDLMRLDLTEGVPGRGYRHVEIEAEDRHGRAIQAITYIAHGKAIDGKPFAALHHANSRRRMNARTARTLHPIFGGRRARRVNLTMFCRLPTLVRRMGLATALFGLLLMPLKPARTLGMELKVVGNQLVLSGRVVGDEPEKVREAFTSSPEIDTVVLRKSPGGDAPAGYQVGQMLRERGIRTAVSGYCYSSCSRMFLGGSTRYFTDDYVPENNNVGFHGHYDRIGRLNANLVRQYGLRDWIIKYSDGKADPVLVERWINIPYSRGMIQFFHPGLVKRAGVSTFMCQGDEDQGSVFACEPIAKTALDLGIVTSLDLVHSADR